MREKKLILVCCAVGALVGCANQHKMCTNTVTETKTRENQVDKTTVSTTETCFDERMFGKTEESRLLLGMANPANKDMVAPPTPENKIIKPAADSTGKGEIAQ